MNLLKQKYPLLSALTTYIDKNWGFDNELISNLSSEQKECIETQTQNKLLLKYFNSVLHDSPVLNIEFSSENIAITLNDYLAYNLAAHLCGKFSVKIPRRKFIFPVTLNFVGLKKLRIARVNKNGKIIYANTSKYIPRLAYWGYDELINISESEINVGVWFFTTYRKGNKCSLLLEIESQQLQILEEQKESFLEMLGKEYLTYWDKFIHQRQSKGDLTQEQLEAVINTTTLNESRI